MKRHRVDHRHGKLLGVAAVMDGVVRVAEHEVGFVLKVSADPRLALGILLRNLLRLERDHFSGKRRVGSRLEDDGHLRLPGLHHGRRHRDSGGQLAAVEHEVAVEVFARRVHKHGVAVATRHEHGLSRLRKAVDAGDREGKGRLRRLELDAIGEVGLAAAKMILDLQDVVAVLRDVERVDRVGALRVVVAAHVLAVGVQDVDHRIEPRAQAAGMALHLERLALLHTEPEVVDVAGVADGAVERQRCVAGGGRLDLVVGLLLERVAKARDPKR